LVARAFIPNPNNYPIVNHLNGRKSDNRVVNLQWTSYSLNTKHAYDTGLRIPCRGESSHSSKLTEKEVLEIRELYSLGGWSFKKLQLKFGLNSYSSVTNIIHRKTWAHI
jgi:hypothetical protein